MRKAGGEERFIMKYDIKKLKLGGFDGSLKKALGNVNPTFTSKRIK